MEFPQRQRYWDELNTLFSKSTMTDENRTKIDSLLYAKGTSYIRQGLALMCVAPEYLCKFLDFDGTSVTLSYKSHYKNPLRMERLFLKFVKTEPLYQNLYTSGAFESMEFRSSTDIPGDQLSDTQKELCIRASKEMVRISSGSFTMGAWEFEEGYPDYAEDIIDAVPSHRVILTKDFLIGKYAVTQALWERVMGTNPSGHTGFRKPVESVSWLDCVTFCNTFSEQEGLTPVYTINDGNVECNWEANGYRLPTEAEWECSASGDRYAGFFDDFDLYAVSDNFSGPEAVGQKLPNERGLYDMSGNVKEWCWDGYYEYSESDATDPRTTTFESGTIRTIRGGSYASEPWFTRVSHREWAGPSETWDVIGFRIARSL